MQKSSFIKGFVIAGFFSSMFWAGAYYAFTNSGNSNAELDHQETINKPNELTDITTVKASL